ncbi:MAG: imidazole glycerol phosphate synthase subunit HisH [Muribaculum sp.]|nr:imidazole glycerol phosphate synthase subunit HisH [Muribaculum sp.]
MIAIIDYGLSNLLSIKRAVDLYTSDVKIVDTPDELIKADKIILPGVGSFHYGMDRLLRLGLRDVIVEQAQAGIPLLGICLGMQMLFDEGDEGGLYEGLGLIPGRVERIPEEDVWGKRQNVPHIGWEKLRLNREAVADRNILGQDAAEQEFYFVHSYEGKPVCAEHCLASVDYGGRAVCAIVQRDQVIGCQFHPEKSGAAGLELVDHFIHHF